MKAFAVLVLLLMIVSLGTASTGIYGVNGSEPGFLQGIGPQEERADRPIAAAVVALGVTAIILRGLYRYEKYESG
ncbi:MAG: hypothetical protein MUP63_01010 [Candidatus Nanohaloarchaeota archaeon QJJ-7]|nr:hypothetical protein [Candidatus Nanohaloarchaeota archaeon QJJ-7]